MLVGEEGVCTKAWWCERERSNTKTGEAPGSKRQQQGEKVWVMEGTIGLYHGAGVGAGNGGSVKYTKTAQNMLL